MRTKLNLIVKGCRGQGMPEYALILLFVVAVTALVLTTDNSGEVGGAISSAFMRVAGSL